MIKKQSLAEILKEMGIDTNEIQVRALVG